MSWETAIKMSSYSRHVLCKKVQEILRQAEKDGKEQTIEDLIRLKSAEQKG